MLDDKVSLAFDRQRPNLPRSVIEIRNRHKPLAIEEAKPAILRSHPQLPCSIPGHCRYDQPRQPIFLREIRNLPALNVAKPPEVPTQSAPSALQQYRANQVAAQPIRTRQRLHHRLPIGKMQMHQPPPRARPHRPIRPRRQRPNRIIRKPIHRGNPHHRPSRRNIIQPIRRPHPQPTPQTRSQSQNHRAGQRMIRNRLLPNTVPEPPQPILARPHPDRSGP